MYSIPKRRLGRTNLSVTELGLGSFRFTSEFGVPRAEAAAILDHALAAGINYIDTAPQYGAGESEELIGRALARNATRPYLSTKVGKLDLTIVRFAGEAAYRDESLLRRVVEHSLHLLQVDYVDVMMIHEPDWPQWGIDRRTGDGPIIQLLESLKREGVIGAIGMGGQDCDLMADLIETDRIDVVLVHRHLDLAVQDARDRLLPAAKKHDVGVVVGGPFRQGVLAVKQRDVIADIRRTGKFRTRFDNEEVVKRIEAIYDLSDETGIDLPEMGIRFLLSEPQVSTIIPGPRTVGELQANLMSASKGPLPAEIHERIINIARS